MNRIMMRKQVCLRIQQNIEMLLRPPQADWAEQRALGRFESEKYPDVDFYVPCRNNYAEAIPNDDNYVFHCENVGTIFLRNITDANTLQIDLYNFRSHASLGSKTGQGSSSWGWTSPEGREFVAIGQADGAAFAEINKDGKLLYLGRLPAYSKPAIWREIRGYKDYMIIGSEAEGHGIQIFDMKKVLFLFLLF